MMRALVVVLGVARAAGRDGNATFFFYECGGDVPAYARPLLAHPRRVVDAGAADVHVSLARCFVGVGFAAVNAAEGEDWVAPARAPPPDPPPPDAIATLFAKGTAFLFAPDPSPFKAWRSAHTHRATTDCAPPGHRPPYDVCLPTPPAARCPAAAADGSPRRYRATFQGLNDTSTKNRLRELHDPSRGRVVSFTDGATSCARTPRPCATRPDKVCFPCLPIEALTDCDLLNASYVIASNPSNPRWLEALAAGAVPVTHYDYRSSRNPLPLDGAVDWEPCTAILHQFPDVYRTVVEPQEAMLTRARACRAIYDAHFADERRVGDTVLTALLAAARHALPKTIPSRSRISFRPPRGASRGAGWLKDGPYDINQEDAGLKI